MPAPGLLHPYEGKRGSSVGWSGAQGMVGEGWESVMEGVSSDHGPVGRKPPEKTKPPNCAACAYTLRVFGRLLLLFTLFTDTLACTVCILSSNY